VHNGDHSVAKLLSIWGLTWDAGVDPWVRDISLAYQQYAAGQTGSCTLTATHLELESGLKHVGLLRAWTQKLAKLFFLVAKGFDTTANQNKLDNLMGQFAELLPRVIAGYTPEKLPVPITQSLADALISFDTSRVSFLSLMSANSTVQTVQIDSLEILAKGEIAATQYEIAARSENKDVGGSLASLASGLLMLVQKMCKEAVLIGLGQDLTSQLTSTIDAYDKSNTLLLQGTAGDTHLIQVELVNTAWGTLKASVQAIASSGVATDAVLDRVISSADTVESILLIAWQCLSRAGHMMCAR